MSKCKYQIMWGLVDHYGIVLDLGSHGDLICTLCHNIIRNPLQSICGCRFCKQCLQDYIESDGKRCPGLTEDCEVQMVHINDQVNPDYAANRDIGDILVKCPLGSCETHCKLIEMDDHIKLHEKCPFYWIGCQTSSIEAFDRHHIDNHHSHMELLVNSIVNTERQANETDSVLENRISEVRGTITEEIKELQTTIEDLAKNKGEMLVLVNGVIDSLEEQHRTDRAKVATDLTRLSVREDLLDAQINRLKVGLESVEKQQELAEEQQRALVTRWDQADIETRLDSLEDNQRQIQTELSACLRMSEKQLGDFAVSNCSMISRLREDLSGHVRNIVDQEIKHAVSSPVQQYWSPQSQHANGQRTIAMPPSPLDVTDHGPKKKRLKTEITPVTPVKVPDSTPIDIHQSPSRPNLRPLKSDSNCLQYVVEKFSSFQPMGNESSVVFTEPFSSPIGHQFRLAVYPNGVDDGAGTHLSLRLLSVPGDLDHVLHWPQRHTFLVSLLNQKTEQPLFSKPCMEIPWLVNRPAVGGLSKHKGQSRFFKLKLLLNNDALYYNDSIVIVVSISI